MSLINIYFKKTSSLVMSLMLTTALSLSVLSCTSQVNEIDEVKSESDSQVEKSSCKGKECQVCVSPWGDVLPHGQILKNVFTKELAGCEEQCDALTITLECESGTLLQVNRGARSIFKGQAFKSCFKKTCDCNFNGQIIPDGMPKLFYKHASRECEERCEQKTLKCISGKILDPSNPTSKVDLTLEYPHTRCEQIECENCRAPWGADYISGGPAFSGFKSSSVACGYDCNANSNKKEFTCSNGRILGGTISEFPNDTCTVTACKPCTLPCGKQVNSGGHNTCYSLVSPQICGDTCFRNSKEFYCFDGIVTNENRVPTPTAEINTYNKADCVNSAAACTQCKAPDGKIVDDGMKLTFYKKNLVECTESCLDQKNAVTLTCSDGQFGNKILYPDFRYSTCSSKCNNVAEGDRGIGRIVGDGGGAPVNMCILPWASQVVTHNTEVVAYSRGSVPAGSSCQPYKKIITCNAYKGLWTGGAVYIYPTCFVEK